MENKLENKILLLGERSPEKTRRILSGFNVFVLASKFEGSPITIVEAMFAGLPIIASDVPSIKELVINGQTGFLVGQNSIKNLVEKMVYFIKNPKEIEKMGKEGQRIAKKKFTLETMIQNYGRLYDAEK